MISTALDSILSHSKGQPYGVLPQPEDWARAEQDLGREIPPDLKALLNQTGAQSLGHCQLRNPADDHGPIEDCIID